MASTAFNSCSSAEKAFGPAIISSCFAGFDFTLLFEDSILTVLPLSIAAFWACVRCFFLWRRPERVRKGALLYLKLGSYATYASLQIALLPIWLASATVTSRLTAASLAIAIGTFVLLAWVAYLEHTRSWQPSTLLILYLAVSILLDLARVRTTFLLDGGNTVPGLNVASLLVKALALVAELTEKTTLVHSDCADPSPEATASIANKSLFLWINNLLWRGFRRHLTVEDLDPLDAELASASRPTHLSELWRNADKSGKDALLLTYLLHYKYSILAGVIPRLCTTGFRFAQPFLVQRVLSFLDGPDESNNVGYGLIGAYVVVYIGLALASALYEYYTNRVMAQFRGSLVSMICRKSLRVNSASASDAEAMTLMSADIDRIALSGHILHESYGSLIELGLSLWLIYRLLGVAMAASAVWLVGSLGLGIPLATVAGNAQVPWLEAIEERLAATAKAIGQIIPIKMAGMAETVSSRIAGLRESEIKASWRYRLMAASMTSASFLASSFTPVVGLGAFALLANAHHTGTLTEDVAFAALTLFDLQQQPASYILNVFEDYQIAINSFRRIQQYLVSDEQHDERGKLLVNADQGEQADAASVGTTADDLDEKKSLYPDSSEVIMIADNAAGGYSPDGELVLQNLEFEIPAGKLTVVLGPVGCGKSTLLRLILGELPVTQGIIKTGFRHAAFCPQTPWVMKGTIRSNILGMLEWDPSWYSLVVEACALRQDFSELPDGDMFLTGTKGSRLSGGQRARISLARAIYSREKVVVLDSVLNGLDATTEKGVIETVFGRRGLLRVANTTVILATNSAAHLALADHVISLNEQGSVRHTGPAEEIDANEASKFASNAAKTDKQQSGNDLDSSQADDDAREHFDTESRKTSDSKVYIFYIRTVGLPLMIVYLLSCATYIVASIFPSIWVQLWTNSNADDPNNRIGYWLGVYGAIAAATIVTSVLSEMLFMLVIVPKTSRRFHQHLLTTLFKATAAFLTTADAGTTTNRFSQDLELIDNDLPQAFDMFILEAMSTISSVVLIFIGSSYIAATVPLCIAILYFIQKFYLRTSRQLRLLDLEAKAPLFSQFLETLNGASCIRAYDWTDEFLERHIRALEDSQKPYYYMVCIQRWLTLVLDLFVAGLAILLVGLATSVRGGASSYLGVALLNIVNFSSTLQSLVTQWTQLETAIGAVNRIRSFAAETPTEDRDDEPQPVSEAWPASGTVAIEHLFASYSSTDAEMTLKDISLTIRPGEKVAICGRTGSGKSSLISAILNLLNIKSGNISIDGVSISDVSREVLRSRLNTLPQEGVISNGSIRDNLESIDVSDDRIITLLTRLQLWKVFEQRGGLEAEVSEDILSHGQRQLFCLARAILKPHCIVLMDESTSSVDSELDEILDQVLEEELHGRTVIAVVHKLHSAMGFDRVVVIAKGRIVEHDDPKVLLEQEGSAFRALYRSMVPRVSSSRHEKL